jgi:hypothetical protein
MKPTLANIERRIEAIENRQAAQDDAPSLTIVFNREDGTPGEMWRSIGGAAGVVLIPQKLTREAWEAKAQQWLESRNAKEMTP